MHERFSGAMKTVAIAGAAVTFVMSLAMAGASAQAAAGSGSGTALTTPWGEPDLQGIWTDETDTPLQRSPKYANQEFFTEAQRAELDRQRSAMLGRDRRAERGTLADVAGAYNDVFTPKKRTGAAHVADRRSAQWPAAAADAGGSEDGRCRTRISTCAVASDRNLQK